MTFPLVSERHWSGWAIERPGLPLFVQYGGDREEAWTIALGWPSQLEIDHARAMGARAFQVRITEIQGTSL